MLSKNGTWMQIWVCLPFVESYVHEDRDLQTQTYDDSTYI